MDEKPKTLPSKDEWEKESKMTLFPIDNYIAKVVNVEEEIKKQSYDSVKARKGRIVDLADLDEKEIITVSEVILLVYGLKSGDDLVDKDGKKVPILARRLWREINPFATGFKTQDGSPTFFRSLMAYAHKMPIECSDIPGEMKSTLGKYVGVDIGISKNGKYNKVDNFTKVPDSFVPNPEIEKEAMEKYSQKNPDKKDKAEDIYGDDKKDDSGATDPDPVDPDVKSDDISVADVPY